jgi:DNA-binding response OmpR family regulator
MGDILKPYILTVDDDLLIQKIIERILTDGGYRVKCIQSAREGLKQVSAEKPALILVDIMMPEMDGYQFCASLQKKSETSYIPVIFLTALETPQSKTKAFSAGAVDYLVKPLDREVLLRKIRSHLETSTRWRDLSLSAGGIDEKMSPSKFVEFKKILLQKFRLPLTVEYRIPFANQQQVNNKAGVTFDVLLKSLVRQDPDILFIGEVRDPY